MPANDVARIQPDELAPAARERLVALDEARRHLTVGAVFGPVMLGAAGAIAWRTAGVLRMGEIYMEPAVVDRAHDPVIFYGLIAILAGCALAAAGMAGWLLRDALRARGRIARIAREA